MTSTTEQDLRVSRNQENLLRRITNRIRLTLELQDILIATVGEVRSFLGTDRVMIYKFNVDSSGQVIAESINDRSLPSLLGLNFPASDIPPDARELFIKSRVRSLVNVDEGKIGQSFACDTQTKEIISEDFRYRPVDPCHVEYLTAMGVQSSLVVPILESEKLWGLLVSHHSQPLCVGKDELEVLQIVVEQLEIAIAHSTLLTLAHRKAEREAIVSRIATLLHSLPTIVLQPALEAAIVAFGGSGGRLCIRNEAFNYQNRSFRSFAECLIPGSDAVKLYISGQQPAIPEQTIYPLMEQYSVWQEHYNRNYDVWAISDIYQTPNLRSLQAAFQPTKIRSILMIPLYYRQQLLGYLSIFRDEIDTETLWAGQYDSDKRQLYPRISFDIWREFKKAQARKWTFEEIELAEEIGKHFASACQQYELYQQVQAFNSDLENQVKKRTVELRRTSQQQQAVFKVIAKIRESLDTDIIFQTTTKEVCQLLKVDRVSVYRFDSDWGGEFVGDFEAASPNWLNDEYKLGINTVWNDTYLQDTQGGRYRNNETFAVDDIYKMGFAQCHIDNLEQFQIHAFVLAPIFVGQKLWGLLATYQHSGPRQWQDIEVDFFSQIAAQIGVALQQAELLKQTQQQTLNLQQAAEQQQVLFEVVAKIRESLSLDAIFQTTTQVVCQSLQTDRVAVYRFNADWSGQFLAEFVGENWVKLITPQINMVWEDSYLQETQGGRYRQNQTFAVNDIYQAGHSDCHFAVLEQFQVKAYAIAPIFIGQQLWGLLAAYQNSAPRHWEASEIKFLAQIAVQLGVALQQAELLAQTKHQAEQLAQALEELQQTQTQLIQTEKMSSLGQLVAGVAHEINNPINFIYGNLGPVCEYANDLLSMLALYQQQYPNPSREICNLAEDIDLEFIAEDLPKILSSLKLGSDRIRQIVLSLRNFSRLDEAQMKQVDIHQGIDSTLLILQHRLKPTPNSRAIEVVKEYGNLPLVECYAGQLNQVFMNVLSNAIDALEESLEKNPGLLSDRPQIRISTEVINNHQVVIRILDNGSGMPEDIKKRIFDPFFTTKPVGKGTGLGLSISYQIVVDKHGGVFKCNSLPDGTEFSIQIPITPIQHF